MSHLWELYLEIKSPKLCPGQSINGFSEMFTCNIILSKIEFPRAEQIMFITQHVAHLGLTMSPKGFY